jgi:hypothetical protein
MGRRGQLGKTWGRAVSKLCFFVNTVVMREFVSEWTLLPFKAKLSEG